MSLPSQSVPATRRWRVLRPIRLSTFLVLILVIALLVSLALQQVHERQLRDALAVYRRLASRRSLIPSPSPCPFLTRTVPGSTNS